MDYLRSAYVTDCVFGTDDTFVQSIQWYRCLRTALPLGFPSAFGSATWQTDEPHQGLGERHPKPSEWRTGAFGEPVAGTGTPCGSVDVWQNGWPGPTPTGLPRDAFGLATCCGNNMSPADVGLLGYNPGLSGLTDDADVHLLTDDPNTFSLTAE